MEFVAKPGLLNERGQPFSSRIDRALHDLLPKLQRQFPTLKDEAVVAEVLEEAGRKIADHEQRSGPLEKLHGYAWVTVRSVAMSRMRRSAMRVEQATVRAEDNHAILSHLPSERGSAEQIEHEILFKEILAQLSRDERAMCMLKKAGFSSKEIAQRLGSSVSAVDTLFHRIKDKIHNPVQSPVPTEKRVMVKAQVRVIDESTGEGNG